MAMKMSEIQLLNDDELYGALLKFNETIGPIVDSTRSLYQSMLFNKLNAEEEMTLLDGIEDVVETTLKDNIMKTVEGNFRRSTSRAPFDEPPPAQTPSPRSFKRWNDDDIGESSQSPWFDNGASFRSRSSLNPRSPIRHNDTPQAVKPAKKSGSIIPIVLLLAFVLMVAAFILLVVTQSPDPYQDIEAEVTKFAEKVVNDGVV